MSSNESVERMLKQLENLLRRQDKDQSKETGAGLEPVGAESGSPGTAEEQEAEDLSPTPAVEVTDNVESQASVDEAREPVYRATGDPVSVGMPGAQGLQVETVPSEEDWYEIGDPETVEAGVNSEQAPAASEIQANAHAGPGLDSSGVSEIRTAEVGASTIEDTAGADLPVEASPPDAAAIGEDEVDDTEELPHRRRRLSIGDLLNRATHSEEQAPEEESPAEEAPVPTSDHEQPVDLADEPREISADDPVEVPDEMGELQATAHALPASGSPDDMGTEELSMSAEGFGTEAEAEPVRPDEDVPDDHGSDGRGVEETTETAARADRPDVEPFVHRDPVVGPPPARKLISEQLREEELVAERQAAAEREAEEVATEDEVDPARALKIVESLAEVMDQRGVDAAEEVAHIEEVVAQDENAAIEDGELDEDVSDINAGGPHIPVIVDDGMVEEKDLASVLSDQYGVPSADVETIEVPRAVLALVPAKMARRYLVLPLSVSEGVVDVAMVDPSDINAIRDLEFTTGLRVQPLIVTEWSIERAIERIYSGEELRSELSDGAAKAAGSTDPRTIIRRMVRDRDEAVLKAERDPHRAYQLAASIDDFVDEILKAVEKPQD